MDNIFTRVLAIRKTGSNEARNELLSDLKDEAVKAASAYLGRMPTGEEYSIALDAVNKAIDSYDQTKSSFKTYSSKMIFYKLMEAFKKEKPKKIFVSYDNTNITILSDIKASEEYKTKESAEDLRDELIRLQKILRNLGYTWADIRQNRPSHKDSLERLKSIALRITSFHLGERYIKENPLSRELKKLIGSGIDRRTLTKYRPYLCSLVIVLTYDFPIMQKYLGFRKESQNERPQRNSR